MNILSSLFGIFRQRGLVSTIKSNGKLTGFILSAFLVSILGGLLYGFSMGVGLGSDTAVKDAVKVALILALINIFSIPIFWVAFRLLGREESLSQIAVVPMTTSAAVSIILAVTAPVVFMLSVLTGFNPNVIYIHIVIVDIALLVGLYLSGMLIYHGFGEHKRLIIPNVVGFLMMAVILVVLISFLSPFLETRTTFSVGTDRLKDSLGIGVFDKVDRSLSGAASAELVEYRFQKTNQNGDVIQDYTVSIVGDDDFRLNVDLHTLSQEDTLFDRHIWVLDGQYYTDFEDGLVTQVDPMELTSILEPALPSTAFTLPSDFKAAAWRAYAAGDRYLATGTSQSRSQAELVLETVSGRLISLTLENSSTSATARTTVNEIQKPELDRQSLESELNVAIVLGGLKQSDATMKDYVQRDTYFVLRIPNSWVVNPWNASEKEVRFKAPCEAGGKCPGLAVRVFDLAEGNASKDYADALAGGLDLLPEYHGFKMSAVHINEEPAGVVEYLFDEVDEGEIKTTYHLVYIFVGQEYRYHLDFTAAKDDFDTYRALYDEISRLFVYLK